MRIYLPYSVAAALALFACSPAADAPRGAASATPAPKEPAAYKIGNAKRWTTLRKIWLPNEALPDTKSAILSGALEVDDLPAYDLYGLAQLHLGPGEDHNLYDAITTSTRTGPRRSILYFAQFSDLHVIDEESPIRLEGVTRIAFASAYRPQDHLTTQMIDALIQSMNAFSFADRPFDFAFISGDIADTAQANEVQWVRALFDGQVVTPDIGFIDDPIPGPGNDFTDPFQATGLDKRVPWYMLFGNHEQMHLGSFNPTAKIKAGAVSNRIDDYWGLSNFTNNEVTFGARDASRPFAPVIRAGTLVPPDSRRHLVDPSEFMQIFVTSPTLPEGHGFTKKNVASGFTSYVAHPVPGFPLTLIALDTVMEMKVNGAGEVIQNAGSEGEISRKLWDGFVVPQLELAQANHELILFTSHHCSTALQDGVTEVKAEEIHNTLKKYPNVLAHLCGHGHRSRLWVWNKTAPGEHGYPELMQASAIDWPIQGRILELVDNGDGTLSLFTTQVEPNATPGMLAYEGMSYASSAQNFPPLSLLPERMWNTDKPFRNMELILPVPPGFDVSSLPGKAPIESLTRLAE
jgi:hypothetical protein